VGANQKRDCWRKGRWYISINADGTREDSKLEKAHHRQLSEAELKREEMGEEQFAQHVDHKQQSDVTFAQSKFQLFGLETLRMTTRDNRL
jgi:hypothetical protein